MAITQSLSQSTTVARVTSRAVGWWLLGCCGLIFAMVVIGGITRLTESGLSIVTWAPIGGTLPPLDHADWQRLFDAYQQTPQYRHVNEGMSLEAFRTIFWWEYVHRLWGRLIGVAFLLPFLWFLASGRIARSLRWPLAGIFALGALQGALGWWMVASGLKDVPWVSPYRLTMHLGLALLIYAAMLWIALDLLRKPAAGAAPAGVRRAALALAALVFVTILAGGFVAGTDAGLIYNSFPWMGDGLVPPDYRNPALSLVHNTFENQPAVQLHHRVLAITTVLAVASFWLFARHRVTSTARRALDLLLAVVLVQATLGISTLLLQVPIPLAALHQAGAVTLLTAALFAAHTFRGTPKPN